MGHQSPGVGGHCAARLPEYAGAARAGVRQGEPVHVHRTAADLVISICRVGVAQAEDGVAVRRGQDHGPAGLVTGARRKRGVGAKVQVDRGDRSAGADQQHAARIGGGSRGELSGGHRGRAGHHRQSAAVHRESTRIGVCAAEGQRTVAHFGQGERGSRSVLQRAAESRAAVIAARGQGHIGRATILDRAGAGQRADGGAESVQAQDAGGLNDVGRSVAEALGDTGLQDAGGDGRRSAVGTGRAREGQDARAVLFETERAGDGAAHGEGRAVDTCADNVPTLVGAEGDRGADSDDAGVSRHIDTIGRHRRGEGEDAGGKRARGDCDRSDSARIGGEFEILDIKICIQGRGDRRAAGGIGAEDDPIVHSGETIGVGAGQIRRKIAREPTVRRPIAVAQRIGPVKVGREGSDAEADEGVGGGQRPGAACDDGETTEGISGAARGQAARGGEQIIIAGFDSAQSAQVKHDLAAHRRGDARGDTVVGGERSEFEAEHGAPGAGSAQSQRQDAGAKIDSLANGVDEIQGSAFMHGDG